MFPDAGWPRRHACTCAASCLFCVVVAATNQHGFACAAWVSAAVRSSKFLLPVLFDSDALRSHIWSLIHLSLKWKKNLESRFVFVLIKITTFQCRSNAYQLFCASERLTVNFNRIFVDHQEIPDPCCFNDPKWLCFFLPSCFYRSNPVLLCISVSHFPQRPALSLNCC